MKCTCRWLRDSAAATGKRISALGTGISGVVMLAALLVGLASAPAYALTFSCAPDAQGVNDEPGQKDLTKMCVAVGSGGFQLFTKWDWDETGTNGNNTMDACSLYDTDLDGNANLAVCVTTIDDPAVKHAVTLYRCDNDSRSDRCTGAVVVTAVATDCTVTSPGDPDPFPTGDSSPNDTTAMCSIALTDFGAVGLHATLLDACSYPSQQPNSDPSDCVLRDVSSECTTAANCNDSNACTTDSCVHDSFTNKNFCTYTPSGSGTTCGGSPSGACDAQDTCSNLAGICDDNVKPVDTECRGAGICNPAEVCDGTSKTCPDDVYSGVGTACGFSTSNTCDAPDTCNGAGVCLTNNVANGTSCGDTGTQCTNQDTCQAGACQDNGFKATGTACGNSSDTVCDNPDTCNGAGSCQINNEPNGTACGDAGTECTNQDTCQAGECQDNGFKASGTSCGSPSDTACDNPDTCNGSGTCLANNEPTTTTCGDAGTECTNQDYCSGTGTCADKGFKASGTACGSSSDTACDNPDTCDGSGACQVNNEPTTKTCGDAETECTKQDYCSGTGTCTDNGFKSAGTSCGSSADTECDNPNTCNGSGTCQANNEPNGTACGDTGTQCTNQDTCLAGVCHDNGYKSSGTACGSSSDTECDNPDTCNGSGTCQGNNEPTTKKCGDTGTECTNQDYCDGSGSCHDNGYKDTKTLCGDKTTDNACTDPDTCDGAGACLPNNTACSYVTDSNLCGFDYDSKLTGRQFNVIFTPDAQLWPGYKQNSTNPGQFYYNAIVTGTPLSSGSVQMSIPWPFITQGANPVHVYNANDVTIDNNLCFRDKGQLPLNGLPYPATITYADWASNTPKNGLVSGGGTYTVSCENPSSSLVNGLDYNCLVTVNFTIPSSGIAYVNIHLDYGTKGGGTDFNPKDTFADRYDIGAANTTNCVGDATYYDALQNDSNAVPAGPLALKTCTTYPFSHTGTGSGGDSVQNVNTFKKIQGVFGQAINSSTDGKSWPNVQATLKDGTGKTVLATGVTDKDGFYALNYKYTGKATNFIIVLGNVQYVVQLKANGWAEVDYDPITGKWYQDVSGK